MAKYHSFEEYKRAYYPGLFKKTWFEKLVEEVHEPREYKIPGKSYQ